MKIQKFNEGDDFDTEFDWEHFKEYVNTYDPKKDGLDDWNVILLDMLYGLGISVDKDEFSYGTGFKKFKEYLNTNVHWKIKKDADIFKI